ncbi:MAG: response regulator [Lachnospiraceae bacterium]|nr:response regulator [Lachnospiraceae bacterium]
MRKFTYLSIIFVLATVTVSAIVTYISQMKQHRDVCMNKIKEVGDYLCGIIMDEPDEFLEYMNYYVEHYEDIRVPVDFTDSYDAKVEFYHAFSENYPGQTFKTDIKPSDMSPELQSLYYSFEQEYWILTFEQARESFGLPYTYFLVPDDDTKYTMYMIDGERTEDPEHPGYLYMGDSYYEEPSEHELMWNTYHNGIRYDEVYEWDNKWGNTYSYYTPLVINGKCMGLIVAEIDVAYVNAKILKSAALPTLQMALLLTVVAASMLYFVKHNYIRRVNHLSEQINDYSASKAYDTYDAIKKYPYGNDEISELADNTAYMINQIRLHEEKIAQAAQFKSDFLANMSHELRTPMNAIVGLSELLNLEGLTGKSREYSDQINSSAKALLVVFDDILDFSRIEQGIIKLSPSEYDVRKEFEMVVSNQALGLNEKNVVMRLNISPDVPGLLIGDSARIRQVMGNVISNAVKFTNEGSIDINVEKKDISEGKIELLISVADTGIGIREQDYEKIFESFSQIDSKRNRSVDGTGLGLAITQRLIKLMNGTIEVESEYGVGSTFSISIPQEISAKAPETPSEESAKEASAGTLHAPDAKVLVVDDNSINRYVAKNLLNLYDIKPACVPSGEHAIKVCGKREFDLVLMDYMMPEMDGIEAMKKIREEYPAYKNIPIIAFTADAVSESRELLLKEGMDDFLPKPVKMSDLEEILKKWLPEERWIR